MRYAVTIGDRTVEVELGPDSVRVDDRALAVELAAVPDSPVRSLLLGTESHRVVAYAQGRDSGISGSEVGISPRRSLTSVRGRSAR